MTSSSSGRAGRLLGGFRGAPPADREGLTELVLSVARLAEDFPEVAELDLNPVIALPDGCAVVDARIRIARPARAHLLKSW